MQAAPGQRVWGSDWPHPTEPVGKKPDHAVLFDRLADRAPDPAVRTCILVDDPAWLYGFTG